MVRSVTIPASVNEVERPMSNLWTSSSEPASGPRDRDVGFRLPLRAPVPYHTDGIVAAERERVAVERSLILLLVGLILLCPFVCCAEVLGVDACAHEATGHSSAPDQCPDGGDNCLCQGAVNAGSIRIANPDLLGVSHLIATPSPTLPHLHAPLTWGGSPTWLAGLRGGLTGRALLQNFRF